MLFLTYKSTTSVFYRHTLFVRCKSAKIPYVVGSAGRCDMGESRLSTYTLSPALKSIALTLLFFAVFLLPKSLFIIRFRLTYNYNRKSKFCEFRCPMKLGCRFFKKSVDLRYNVCRAKCLKAFCTAVITATKSKRFSSIDRSYCCARLGGFAN